MVDPQQNQTSQFDVQGARAAGASDDDILNHLATSRGFDLQGALKAGAAKQDIIQHLSMQPAHSSTPPAPNAGLAGPANSGISIPARSVGLLNTQNYDDQFNPVDTNNKPQPMGMLDKAYKAIANPMTHIDEDLTPDQQFTHPTASPDGKSVVPGKPLPATPAQPLKDAHRAVQATFSVGSPLIAGGIAAPLRTAATLATAYGVGKIARGGTSLITDNPDIQDVAEDTGNVLGGMVGGKKFFSPEKAPSGAPVDAEKAYNVINKGNASSDQPSILPEVRNAAATEAAASQPQTGLAGTMAKVKSAVGVNPQVQVPKGKAGVRVIENLTQKAIDAHEAETQPIKQQFANEELDNSSAGQAARSQVTPEMQQAAQNGDGGVQKQIAAIDEVAKRAEGANSIVTTDQLRHSWNDELHGLYSKSAAAQDVAPAVQQAKQAALNTLRGNFYSRLGELSGQDLSPLAKREGLLLEAKDASRKSGDSALEAKGNDLSRAQAVKKAALKFEPIDRPASIITSLPEIIRAIVNPEGQTPAGQYVSRVKRSLSNLPAPTPVSAPPFPGGKVPVQQSFPQGGPLFDVINQTPVPPSQKGAAIPFGADDLLEPGSGTNSTKSPSGYTPNQPVAAHIDPQTRAGMEGAEYGGYKVGSDETPNYGQTRRPLVTEEHPEIDATHRGVTAITNSFQNGKKPLALPSGQYEGKESPLPAFINQLIESMQQSGKPKLGPAGSIQLGPGETLPPVSGGSTGLPPALEGAITRGGDRRAFVRDAMNSAGITAQANGILQKAGLRIGQYNSELGTVSFEDPANQNRFAVMQASDLLKGGPEAARAAIAKVAKPAPPRAGVKK